MNEDKQSTLDELLPQIKHAGKLAFLENYPKFLVARTTAHAIGINQCTVYDWLNKDDTFNRAFHEIKKEITQHLIELHEKNIDDVALNPQTKDQSRIFGSLVRLRAEWPDKYREKPLIDKAIIGDIIIKESVPDRQYPEQIDSLTVKAEEIPVDSLTVKEKVYELEPEDIPF